MRTPMEFKERFVGRTFRNEIIELDGREFEHCEFVNCMVIVRRGETRLHRCTFDRCKLMLKDEAYTVGKIIQALTHGRGVKVLDLTEEPPAPNESE